MIQSRALRPDDLILREGFLRRDNQTRARRPEEKLPILRCVCGCVFLKKDDQS